MSKKALIKEIIDVYEQEYPTASGAFDEFVTKVIPNIINNFEDKYHWHDLLKYPNDLPDTPTQVEVYGVNYHHAFAKFSRWYDPNDNTYYHAWVRFDAWSSNEVLENVLKWRYIAPIDEESK